MPICYLMLGKKVLREINSTLSRPTKILINLKNYGHNIEIAKKLSNSEVILVVKANAYGHGSKELSTFAYDNHNIRYFAVATFEEALELHDILNKNAKLIVLGYVDPTFVRSASEKNIILTVYNEEIAKLYSEHLYDTDTLKIALKIDTGMNRLGFEPELDIDNFLKKYIKFDIFTIMSHLSSADSDSEYTYYQMKSFNNILKYAGNSYSTSLFNSAGICNFKNQYTFTRPGIMTYGYIKSSRDVKLKKVMYLFTNIVHVHNIKKGERIGYNGAYIAPRDMRIGILPIGYGDGYRRNLSNNGFVYINNIRCNIIGNICMDMTMIDISALPESYLNYDVEILGDNIDANILADLSGSIPYEILTNFSSRIKRYYMSF